MKYIIMTSFIVVILSAKMTTKKKEMNVKIKIRRLKIKVKHTNCIYILFILIIFFKVYFTLILHVRK